MKRTVLIALSSIGLGLTVVPAFLVYAGRIDWATHAWLMSIGAILWFATAPPWMRGRDADPDAGDAPGTTTPELP